MFSGSNVSITCKPAPVNTGILFRCVDLPHKPEIRASIGAVHSTQRTMILGGQGVTIRCVEHLLAALYAFQIDNVIIEVVGGEVPICDGSAEEFVCEIQKSGITEQDQKRTIYTLATPIWWSEKEIHLVALPSEELRYSYTLNYPGHPLLDSQFYSFVMSEKGFLQEIAPSRTFSLHEEVVQLLERGLIKGGGLENSVVVKGREVLNPEGLKFKDEMVRHKILDLIGDLALIGVPIKAHFIAVKSGHASHVQLARKVADAIGY